MIQFFRSKKKWILAVRHFIAWGILFSLPYLLRLSVGDHRPAPPYQYRYDLHYLINCTTWIGLFYLNAYILLPRFVYKKQNGIYLSILLVVVVLLFLINCYSFKWLLPELTFQISGFAFFYLFPCLFILVSSIAYKTLLDKAVQDKLAKERETENLKTELAFLRSQVGPHFMFNVLNNMVALARKKSDALEPSLIKLSALLRYMLYEAEEEIVPLEKEVEYLHSYIDLQKQRFGSHIQVKASLDNIDSAYRMAPMLLIPFVENAFKHGAGLVEDAYIDVHLMARNHVLTFTVANKHNGRAAEEKDRTSGIGLANVSRRLNLLYPNKHTLLITRREDQFIVSFQLNLN
jgi:two-component system, LytTR family, sensor kinase